MKTVVTGGSGLAAGKLHPASTPVLRARPRSTIRPSCNRTRSTAASAAMFPEIICLPLVATKTTGVSLSRGCHGACTFHPFVHGTTHAGAVSPRKPVSHATRRRAAGSLSAAIFRTTR